MTATLTDRREATGYTFDNDAPEAVVHHAALAGVLDPVSRARSRDLIDLRGKRCLEIGAGGGGFALWLAEQVAPGRYVLARDHKPEHIPAHPRMTRVRHDLTTQALPEVGRWDFIHARCVLSHLPSRRQVLHELGTALAPGGLLLIEDWETRPADQMVASAPSREDAALFAQYQQAASDLLGRRGHDSTWARRTHAAMLEEELADVETVVSASTWPGGSHGCRHALAAHGQMRPHLVEAGMTDRQLDRVAALLEDPAFVLHGRLLHSVSGWRLAGRRLRSGASRLS